MRHPFSGVIVVSKKVEEIIKQYPEVEFVTTAAGFSLLSGSMTQQFGIYFRFFEGLEPSADHRQGSGGAV